MPRKPARRAKLPRIFDQAEQALAVVDANLEVRYANEHCCQWLGLSAEDLVGRALVYSSVPPSDSQPIDPAAGLCPPPESFESEHTTQGWVFSSLAATSPSDPTSMQRTWKQATFLPLANGEESDCLILVWTHGPDVANPSSGPGKSETRSAPFSQHHLLAQLSASEKPFFDFASLVGASDYASRIRRQIQAVAANGSDCLIAGPPGSGKEHIARTIFHARQSNREQASLVPVHCAIADSQLLQNSIKEWVFEQREHGSCDWLLLLDVDQLSIEGQSELLGYTQLPDFNLRIIATSQTELTALAEQRKFSRPLAMHLSVQVVQTIPLCQRPTDIPLLAQWFVESQNHQSSHQISGLQPEVGELLQEYQWPRNVDELRQVIEQACNHCSTSLIAAKDLPDFFHHSLSAARIGHHSFVPIVLDDYLAEIETELIRRALQQTGNNKTKAAQLLGINRAKLLRRADALHLNPKPTPSTDNLVDESAFKEAE